MRAKRIAVVGCAPAVLAGLAALAFGQPAGAQTTTSYQSPDPTSILDSLDFGAIAGRIKAGVNFATSYDSNVARSTASVAAKRGLRLEDETFTPVVNLDFLHPIGRQSAFLSGSVGYNFYAHNDILNRENLDLRSGLNLQFGSCRTTVEADYDRRQNDLDDVTRGRVEDTFEQTTTSLNASCGREIGFAPVAAVSESFSANSDVLSVSSNSKTFSSSAGLAYQSPANGKLSLFGQYQTTHFPNRAVIVDQVSVQDGYKLYGGGFKYERVLGARLQGSVSAHYTMVSTHGASTFKGVTYDTNLNYQISSRLSLKASFGRDVKPSNVLNATYLVESNDVVEGTYNLGARLKVGLGASKQTGQENGISLIPTIDLNRFDTKSIFASATYFSASRLSFSLNVKNSRRVTNQVGLSYSNTLVSLRAAGQF